MNNNIFFALSHAISLKVKKPTFYMVFEMVQYWESKDKFRWDDYIKFSETKIGKGPQKK